MKSKQWIIQERRRLKRGLRTITREKKNLHKELPLVLLCGDYLRSRDMGRKIMALRTETHSITQRIKQLTKILKEELQ